MEELSLDNILETGDIENLFIEDEGTQDTPPVEDNNPEGEEKEETTEVNVDSLFTEEPESVGSGKDNIEEQEDTDSQGDGTSPKNFYSSIAKALKEEGVFPDLDDETFSNIKSPEDFRDLIDQQIKSGLEERQRRIDEALNVGVEPTEIRKYETTINYLHSIKDDAISNESDEGEKLRKNLIYQDFINRGYSKERAAREVQKSFNAGTDIEDAKEALKSNIDFFNDKYEELVNEAKAEVEKEERKTKEQAEKLKSSILNDKNVFGDLTLDKSTRQRIYDNISKPVYKDPETGEVYTAIQKYELENRTEFLKNVGLLFTLTDGFKNLDGLVKGKVKKEVKKGLRELEHTLNNTSRTSDGNLKFISGVDEDPESFIGKGWSLDV
jgi:vacuolar-type H+-ATPase subunit H